jgi:AmpD protein
MLIKTLHLLNIMYSIDEAGWCRELRHADCTNFDARPQGVPIDLLVIHNISLPPGEFGGEQIEALFANRLDCDAHPYFDQLRGLRVSSHFLIRRDGSALQFVSTHDRAWHAGLSTFDGRERCNDFSIGIELEGSDMQDFCDAQYVTLAALGAALIRRHPISAVRGHEHIAPGRKTDPGPHFNWPRFQRELAALQNDHTLSDVATRFTVSFPT